MQHQSLKKQRHEFTLAQQRVEGHLPSGVVTAYDKSSGPYIATSPLYEISRGLQGLRGLVGLVLLQGSIEFLENEVDEP